MESKSDFYSGKHESKDYGANTYNMDDLFGSRVFRRWLENRKGKPLRILDVGVGKGVFLRDLVTGIKSKWDLAPTHITGLDLFVCTDNFYAEVSSSFEFVKQDIDGKQLNFKDRSYDFVSCNHVLEHIFETEQLVTELRRVIDPDGFCIISVPNIATWPNRIGMLWGNQPLGSELGTKSVTYGFRPRRFQRHLAQFNPSGHIRDFTPRGLKDLVEACGFTTVGWWKQYKGFLAGLNKWAGREMGILLKPANRNPTNGAA